LPAALTIAASTGVISGVPSVTFSGNITFTVKDSATPQGTATASLPLTINPALTVTTTSLAAGTVGVPYNAQVAATGGTAPYSWFASLPGSLTVNSAGQIGGTPTAAFTGNVTITVSDSSVVQNHASQTFTLTIAPATSALTITTATLANPTVGAPYSAFVAATGGTPPYSWSATGLPPNLAITSGTGQISGTPTAPPLSPASATITVTDSATPPAAVSQTYTLTVDPPFVLNSTPLPNGVVGIPFNPTPVSASGGLPPYTWSATGLPVPLTINSGTGQISGTPTGPFSGSVTITAHDSSTPPNNGLQTLSLTINAGLTITTPSLLTGSVNTSYGYSLTAAGGLAPYTWSAAGLPAPLAIGPSTELIGDIPSAAFSGNVTITVKDSATPQSTATVSLALAISPPLTITTASLPPGAVGTAYSAQLGASGGTPPYSWFVSLPVSLTVNSAGQIGGTPTAPFNGGVTITVFDSSTVQNHASQSFALSIQPSGSGILTIGAAGPVSADAPFQVGYAGNLQVGESFIAISNSGANGAPVLGPGFGTAAGNICVNVYAFSPDEQLISCCSCLVTPNGLVSLGVGSDLTSRTLTGVIPTSVVIKVVGSLAGAGGSSTNCSNSAATVTTATLVPGTLAWGTTLHSFGTDAGYSVTETPFVPATLSTGELASIGGRCAAILANGSGFGVCSSCRAGALGAGRQ
jgi:hypothetical protein